MENNSNRLKWFPLVAQIIVKSLPGVSETWEDLLEKEMATHSSILAWKNPMDGGAWQATVHGVAKSWTRLSDFTLGKRRSLSPLLSQIRSV